MVEWDGEDSFSQVAKKSLVGATDHDPSEGDHVAVKVGMKQVYNGIVLTKGEVLTFVKNTCMHIIIPCSLWL